MSLLLKNESRSSPLKISLYRLFNESKIYTTILQPQQSSKIPLGDLRDKNKGLDPSVLLLSVQTLKNNLIWKNTYVLKQLLIQI